MTAENSLLAALPYQTSENLAPYLKRVSLLRGKILHQPGETIQEIYFPIDCLISITITMSDGARAETGMAGKREILGVNALMGNSETTQTEYMVQVPGNAMKIEAQVLRHEFEHNQAVRAVLLRCTQALIAQISQTTACNRLHSLEQRLARWLLEAQYRLESNELRLTQEFLADMLGVRRAGVTEAAQKLQENGIIQYRRGQVHILNLQQLEASSCECFRTVKHEYERLLEGVK